MRVWVIGVAAVLLVSAGCTSGDKPVVLSSSTVSTNSNRGSAADYPGPGDHLHLAFGIYVCDQYLPPLVDRAPDVSGIHTHADGVIHVHPFTERYSGSNANLGVFGDIVGLQFGDGSVTLPDGAVLPDDIQCNGVPAELVVVAGSVDDPAMEWHPFSGDLSTVPLDLDRGVIVIAAVAPGTTIPWPPGAATLDSLSDAPPTTR
jgi:hypothetical protein